MTPYELDILLWYHVRCEDHEQLQRLNRDEYAGYGLVRETFTKFVDSGLLRYVPESERENEWGMTYRATERLHAFCCALQEVPLPDAAWVTRWPAGSHMSLKV